MKQTVCKRTAATYLSLTQVWSLVSLADAEEREREGVGAAQELQGLDKKLIEMKCTKMNVKLHLL